MAGGVPQHRGQEPDPARAGGERGLRRVQQPGHTLDAQGAGRPNQGGACPAVQELGPPVRLPVIVAGDAGCMSVRAILISARCG